MLPILTLRNQTCLAANLVVASCVNTDFWLDKITRELCHTRELRHFLQNRFALSRYNAQHEQILLQKSRTTLYFDQQIFATCNNLICWKTGLKEASKTSNIAFRLVLQQCCKRSCTVLLPDLPWLDIPWYGTVRLQYRISYIKITWSTDYFTEFFSTSMLNVVFSTMNKL